MKAPAALGIDVIAVVIFGILGRAAHGDALTPLGVAITSWPFIGALVIGWLILRLWRSPDQWRRAVALVLITVALGHGLRVLVAGDTTHWTFVTVSLVVLAVLLIGWRLVMQFVHPSPAEAKPLSQGVHKY